MSRMPGQAPCSPDMLMPLVTFKTIGCRLNQAETAAMAADFKNAGYEIAAFGTPCDVCVINSCVVTANAEKDSIRTVRQARRSGAACVVMAGCAVQAARERLLDAGADILVDQAGKRGLPGLVAQRGFAGSCPEKPGSGYLPVFRTTRGIVKIQDGCDFNCSYCIVPRARGRPESRPFNEIIAEASALAARGFMEISLTGANAGLYECDGKSIIDLLEAVEGLSDVKRIRLSSIEFSTVEKPIVDFMSGSRKLCRYLHIPLQSGDDGVLSLMGRRYGVGRYVEFAGYALDRMPMLGLGTDVIAGFPGETAEAFENTCRIISELPFGNVHVFPYSIRPGTRAAALPGHVGEREIKRRARLLGTLASGKARDFARRFTGRDVSVLVETVRNGVGFGWTGEYVRAAIHSTGIARNSLVTFRPSMYDGQYLRA